MSLITPVLGLASGACLAAIRLRHLEGWSLLDREARQELGKPLDRTDRSLAVASAAFFVATLVALAVLGL